MTSYLRRAAILLLVLAFVMSFSFVVVAAYTFPPLVITIGPPDDVLSAR